MVFIEKIAATSSWWLKLCLAIASMHCSLSFVAAQQLLPPIGVFRAGVKPEALGLSYLEYVEAQEFKFVSRVCQLSDEQNKRLDGLSDDLIKQTAANVGRTIGADSMHVQLKNGALNVSLTVVNRFRQQLREQYKEALTEKQQADFQTELDARLAFTRQSVAECLLIIIDERISLEPHQRQPLLDSLKSWDEGESIALNYFFQGNSDNQLPPIPEKFLKPYLSSEQFKTLQGIPRVYAQRHIVIDSDQINDW